MAIARILPTACSPVEVATMPPSSRSSLEEIADDLEQLHGPRP
jgi:hypothetical protein